MRESVLPRALLVTALLATSIDAQAQNQLDLVEAGARAAALKAMDQTSERFACEFEEVAMEGLGREQYLVEVRATGDECNEAMTFLVNSADRDGKLVFRQINFAPAPPSVLPPNSLIYEVNPALTDATDESESDEDRRPDPQ